jgi:ABC-type glycerol-3-phosphate transport system substrate-binding protein
MKGEDNMKLNKRVMTLAVALVMLAVNASFAEGIFKKEQYKLPDDIAGNAYMSNVVYLGDSLYTLVNGDSIYRLKKDDEYFSLYAKESNRDIKGTNNISSLYTDGEALYALCLDSGEFFEIGEKNGALIRNNLVKLNLENHKETYEDESGNEISYNNHPQESMLYGGKFFTVYRGTNGLSGTTLSSFDIKTGEETMYTAENIQAMAAYKDGKLLVVSQDMEKYYKSDDPKDAEVTLSVFDYENDSLEELGPLYIQDNPNQFYGAIVYDKNRDAVMYFTDSGLMLRNKDASTQKCAHFPQMFSLGQSGSFAMLPDSRIAIIIENSVYIESTDPANLPKKTLVAYNTLSNNHDYVLKQMRDTAITMDYGESFTSGQDLSQSLVSGTSNVDIFQLDASYLDTNSIMEKGYALDITEVKGVKEFVDSLYPYLKEACGKDGKIYALPVYMYYDAYTQNKLLLKDLNINAPKTFAQMCDLLVDWLKNEELASQYSFCEDPDIKHFMWDMLFKLYSNHVYSSGEELSYDTPLFRSMVEKLAETLKNIPEMKELSSQSDYEEFYSKPVMFSHNGLDLHQMNYEAEDERWFELVAENPLLSDNYENSDGYTQAMDYLPLKAAEDSIEGFGMEISLVFVNSKTHDPDNAKKYMENFVKGYRDEDKLTMLKDFREPKLNKYYEQSMEDYSERIEAAKQELEKAEGAEKTQLEKDLARMEIRYKIMLEGLGKYEYTQEIVDKYKSFLNNVYVMDFDKYQATGQEQIMTLKDRFIEGQMDLEMFIKEIDAKLNLIKLENQ